MLSASQPGMSEMVGLLIVGAGALGREVLAIAEDCRSAGAELRVKGFLDRNPRALDGHAVDLPVLGDVAGYSFEPDKRFVIALGDPRARARAAASIVQGGGRLHSLIHPQAKLAPRARLGDGCVLAAFCFVAVDARLGRNVFLNNYASVGHDSTVGDDTVLSPYATLNGDVSLGEASFLGTHATVTRGSQVGARVRVTAGSVVYGKVPADALAHGNRAKKRILTHPDD